MSEQRGLLTGEHFMLGDYAAAEGAILAGCRFFAGYPITPATEIAERMSVRLPQVGGVYIQMEDELASMNAVLGSSWAGVKSMTATSGPGFSLMMENLGLGVMLETPCVLVNVQRGGPSTGLPTTPVLVMTDAEVGHMTEKVVIPPPEEVEIVNRPQVCRGDVEPDLFRIYRGLASPDGDGYISPMAVAGEGYRIHVTGLTHDERGYPAMYAEAQARNIARLMNKIRNHRDDIIQIEERYLDDAEVVVVAYGISARTSLWPIEQARQEGIRVGYLRLITVWPFPEEHIRALASAGGQAQVFGANQPGGDILEPHHVLSVIHQAAGRPAQPEEG